ncbi:MAG: hypothetical protein FLDDKLPJ_03411 [Phycisphaerae bacterium]|nr:hypothetical protein [Phycisphaerae bacterium]
MAARKATLDGPQVGRCNITGVDAQSTTVSGRLNPGAEATSIPPDDVQTRASAAPASCALIERAADLEAFAAEWDDLLSDSPSRTLFLTPDWVRSWMRTVRPEVRVLVVAARDAEGRLVGLAPFYVASMRLVNLVRFRCLRVLGDTFCGAEYPDVIVRHGCEAVGAELLQALEARGDRWDVMWMTKLAGWTGAAERIRASADKFGWRVQSRDRAFSCVSLPETFEAFFARLSSNARSMLRRRMKQLTAAGIAFERFHDAAPLPEALETLFRLNDLRWSAVGLRGSFFRKPKEADFYRDFAPRAQDRGWLRMYAARLAGQIVAVQLGYVYDGVYHQMQEGFDPSAPRGVGNALRQWSIERLIEEGVRTYDFLGGLTEHKRRWLAEPRAGSDLLIGRPTLKNRLLFTRPVWPTGRYLRDPDDVRHDPPPPEPAETDEA